MKPGAMHLPAVPSPSAPEQVQENTQPPAPNIRLARTQKREFGQSGTKPAADRAKKLRYQPGMALQDLLQQALELQVSDLHLHSGARIRVRLGGKLWDATEDVLDPDECERLIKSVLNEVQLDALQSRLQVDFAFELPGIGRFRANAYKQQRGIDAVFRSISLSPPTLARLGLPDEFKKFTEFHQGLILFTGPAGCGKSSTMAAMVNLINQSRSDHILTIEDPVEFVHTSACCNVTQREIGPHTESFSRALRAALREDPDVIVIGELRDLETISLAITAAETGHLVMATLHTSNAIRTINRLLGVFPPDQLSQIRRMLSESLKVVISQLLVPRKDGKGCVAALEVMINNDAVANLIRESRTSQIKTILQTGASQGQQLMDNSLMRLVKQNIISREEALRYAEEDRKFE